MNNYSFLDNLLITIVTKGVTVIIKDNFNCKLLNHNNNSEQNGLILGYKNNFDLNKKYKTKKLMGVIIMSNGNNVVIVKLANRNFTIKRFELQLKQYIANYEKNN